MKHKFSQFVIDIGNFCERKFHKIHVVYIVRINLLQYKVMFVRA